MDAFTTVGEVVPAEDVVPGDLVLTGDKLLGIPAFIEVEVVLVTDNKLVLQLSTGRTVALLPTTEVLRL